MVSERSLGNLLLCVAAMALLAGSFALPWWTYDHSTGRQAPEGGFHDPADDGVVRESWQAKPGTGTGTLEADDLPATAQALDGMAWLLYAALGLGVLSVLSELPALSRVLVRRVTLALNALAIACCGGALAVAWFVLPEAFGHGVTGPFSSFIDGSGYTMTRLQEGWAVAALAIPAFFGGFLFKFQAGAPDPTVVVDLYAQGEI